VNTSLADWLQGWGTVAGSVFSAIAAITALALYWREISNRRLDQQDRITRQARNVLLTIIAPRRPAQLEEVTVVASNFTDEVILSFCYRVHRRDSGAEVLSFSSDVTEPSFKWDREVRLEPVMRCDKPEDPVSLFELNYWFTDARGNNWHRMDRDPPERTQNLPFEEWAEFSNTRDLKQDLSDS
jgi:hypothetical protein